MNNNTILQEALEWWNNLPYELKSKFPEPQSNEDIYAYYDSPAEYLYDSLYDSMEQFCKY